MRPGRLCALFAVTLVITAPGAGAQTAQFSLPDTTLVVLTGDSAYADLVLGSNGGVSAYRVTLQYDESQVRVVRADTVPGWSQLFPTPTLALQTNQATLSLGGNFGNASFNNFVSRVWFLVDPAASSGSIVSIRVDSLLNQAGANALGTQTHYQIPLRVCRAVRRYGDVDVDRRITSRDALIVLTEAVGIPTSGFELQWSDVDRDGVSTSRDALFILSEGIKLFHGTVAGKNVADRCDPLQPAPADVAFYNTTTGQLLVIASGDTVPVVVARTTAYDVTDRPGFSPDGVRIAYEYANNIYAVNLDGSNPDTLTSGCCNNNPQWSPDGTQIAFVSTRTLRDAIWLMDADGSNQVQLSVGITNIEELSWAGDGSRIVFTGRDSLSTTNQDRVWSIGPSGTGLVQIETVEPGYNADQVSVSPAVDSVAYSANGTLHVMSLQDNAQTTILTMPLNVDGTAWTGSGFVFTANPWVYQALMVRRSTDGRVLRLTRNESFSISRPSARNPNQVYVNQVALTPTSLTFTSTTAPPQSLTATVTNSDLTTNVTVPVTWISRNGAVASVDQTGNVSPVGVGGPIYVVAHVRGWRADSVQVTVN